MTLASTADPAMQAESSADAAGQAFRRVRDWTTTLAAPLSPEDACVQSMPDASPAKWHLAHTSWFFEHFILAKRLPGYRLFHERFEYLFNSYYFTVGQMHARPRRGLVTRPSLAEVLDYRAHVDAAMEELVAREQGNAELAFLLTLGMNHEQQHQELLLTDIKHLFAQNPLLPAYTELPAPTEVRTAPLRWIPGTAGAAAIGHAGDEFAFDNETPRHPVLLGEHSLASRLVSNAEFREFIDDGGYSNPALWLSDGWSTILGEGWQRPLYWQADLEQEFTLGGLQPIQPAAPVTHLSYFEADAFARWAGCRLPTEFEWEAAAGGLAVTGNFADAGALHPRPAADSAGLQQLYGDAWEWTASPYSPYPGFRPLAGSLGEYNGKFMCSQMVLRGGSCATPAGHVRASYRNFFYPAQRWQFGGVRLAKDAA
ncbi:MAG: ergothioneine biosynthesis protein EgtB [Gammaproteobacteria bacterium]